MSFRREGPEHRRREAPRRHSCAQAFVTSRTAREGYYELAEVFVDVPMPAHVVERVREWAVLIG